MIRNGNAPVNGLELARAYYEQCGKSALAKRFPELAERMAVGLAGEGSECFGFDDGLSVDHDFGPGFCIWLLPEDFAAMGEAVQQWYDSLPKSFMGFPAKRDGPHSGRRVGALAVHGFYRRYTGAPDARLTPLQWLRLPETGLATATNGRVFADPAGAFTAIREAFLAYYPEDARIKKIAARAAGMAQSGQYNYARCMRRGEVTAARLALAEFMQNAMSMLFLLERRHMPFYKWAHRALRELPLPPEAAVTLTALAANAIDERHWQNPPADGLNTGDPNVLLVERLCALVTGILKQQELTWGDDDFLAVHAERAMTRIEDGAIRALHLLDG